MGAQEEEEEEQVEEQEVEEEEQQTPSYVHQVWDDHLMRIKSPKKSFIFVQT